MANKSFLFTTFNIETHKISLPNTNEPNNKVCITRPFINTHKYANQKPKTKNTHTQIIRTNVQLK